MPSCVWALGVLAVSGLFGCAKATPPPKDRPSSALQDHVTASPPRLTQGKPDQRGRPEAQTRSLFLSSVPITASDEVLSLARQAASDALLAKELGATWSQQEPDPLLQQRLLDIKKVERGFFAPELTLSPDFSPPTAAESRDSFVVDYNEAAVQAVVKEFGTPKKTPQQWERFVHDYITEKTYRRSFDIASQVAKYRAGDCTEHAVLLTALLRSAGVPARVIFGIVIVISAEGIIAGRHAWTEYFDDSEWIKVDAAVYQAEQIAIDTAGNASRGSIFGVVGAVGKNDGQESQTQPAVVRRIYLPQLQLPNETSSASNSLWPLLNRHLYDLTLAVGQ